MNRRPYACKAYALPAELTPHMEPRVGFEPTTCTLLVCCSGQLSYRGKSALFIQPTAIGTGMRIMLFDCGNHLGYWRKRQDSNLHAVADERFSRPRQYQLCLLFHMRDAPGELLRRPGYLLWHMTSILACSFLPTLYITKQIVLLCSRRRGRDSNPRTLNRVGSLAGNWFKPLTHLSIKI